MSSLLAAAADALPFALVVTDLGGRVLAYNRAFVALATSPHNPRLQGDALTRLFDDPAPVLTLLRDLSTGAPFTQALVELARPGGQKVRCRVMGAAMRDHEGRVIGAILALDALPATPEHTPLLHEAGETQDILFSTLRTAQTMPDLLERALDAAAKMMGFDVAVAATVEALAGERACAFRGLPPAAQERLKTGVCAAGWFEDKPRVWSGEGDLSELGLPHPLLEIFQEEKVASACRVPLYVADRVIGFAAFGSRTPGHFREATCKQLQALTKELALVTAELVLRYVWGRESQFQRRLLDVAHAINAGVQLEELMNLVSQTVLECAEAKWCRIQVLDEDGQTFTNTYWAGASEQDKHGNWGTADPVAWEAVRTGSVVTKSEDGARGGATIAVPMMRGSQAIGALVLARDQEKGDHVSLLPTLQLFAAQAATGLLHARLCEIARRQTEHMEAVAAQAWQEEARARTLFQIAAAVTEKTDLQDILADLARAVCREIGFERARIYLAYPERHSLNGELEMRANGEPIRLEGETVPLLPSQDNPLAEAALGSAPYLIDVIEEQLNGETSRYERLVTPMVSRHTLVGLIVADNPESRAPVSPRQTRLLRELAGLASVAIERARIDKLRNALISSVSHELRAPLASIRAYNELVLGGDAGEINDEQRLFLERVDKACLKLERVISDLMNLSKLKAGDVSVNRVPTDINALVQGVLDVMHPRALEAGVTVNYQELTPLPPVTTDPGRVEQVLINLVDNAIKFNRPGGWVRVTADAKNGEIILSVADNGPGIPQSHATLIFEEFQHGTDDASRAKEGAGLGLAIAKRVSEVLGGRLWFESELGVGTTFYFAFPFEPAEGPSVARKP